MECPKCQTENKASRRFCSKCGAPLSIKCPNCGFVNDLEDRFCGECGQSLIKGKGRRTEGGKNEADLTTLTTAKTVVPTKLEEIHAQLQSFMPKGLVDKILSARGHIEGERKIVTALFADMVGSSTLAQKFDPEEIASITNDYFHILSQAIYNYEGSIDRLMGDGMMALFGAPIVHENDPQRAILAALEMQKEVNRLSEKLQKEVGIVIQIRVGINTGMVVVDKIGSDLRMEYTAIGNAVNLASRLEKMADAGKILVGESTYKLTYRFFDFASPQIVSVKGLDAPVNIYEVIGVRAQPQPLRGVPQIGTSRFIGRQKELNLIQERLAEMERGKGQVIAIVGEPGIGKTRLVYEGKRWLEARGMRILMGSCVSYGTNVDYLPFIEIIKDLCQISLGDDVEIAKGKLVSTLEGIDSSLKEEAPILGEMLSLPFSREEIPAGSINIEVLDAEQRKYLTIQAVKRMLLAYVETPRRGVSTHRQPLILIFEDLHWSDALSIELLTNLMESLANVSLGVIITYRLEFSHSWGNRSYYTQLNLASLSESECRQLVEGILEIPEFPPEVRDLILRKSEGNPLFTEEVIRSLIESGILVRVGNSWRATQAVEKIHVPDTIQGVIQGRMDHLDEDTKRVLQYAAVIGRSFPARLLERVTEMEIPSGLEENLSHLEQLELVYKKTLLPELEYIFKHALTQEVAYNSLLIRRRREYHDRVGSVIEEIYPQQLESFYEMLAYHYSESNNVDKAVVYLTKSGHKSRALYDNTNAIRFYQQCLDKFGRLKTPKPELQKEVYEGLGDVCQLIGNYKEAINSYNILIEKESDIFSLARANRKLGEVHEKIAKYDQALSYFNSGIELLGESDESVEYAMLLNDIGWIYSRKSDYQQALEYCERALKIAIKSEEYNTIASIYNRLGVICGSQGKGEINLAIEYQKRALEIRRKMGDVQGEASSYNYVGWEYQMAGKLDEALEYFKNSLELKEKIGDARGIAAAWGNLATAYFKLGDYDKAIEGQKKCIEISEEIGNLDIAATAYNNLGMIFRIRKDHEKAIECYQKGIIIFEQIGDIAKAAVCVMNIGNAYVNKGELDKAIPFLEKALERFQRTGHGIGISESYINIGDVYYDRQEIKIAIEYYKKGLEMSQKSNHASGNGYSHYGLGKAYAKLGERDLALDYFSKALKIYEDLKHSRFIQKVKDEIAEISIKPEE